MSVESGCTYSTATSVFDATIVGTRNVNDFRFFGLSEGPGIQLTQLANVVQIAQRPAESIRGLYMGMGDDFQYSSSLTYLPQLNSSGLGQYNHNLYDNGLITPPIDGPYIVSWLVSHIGTSLNVFLEDVNTSEIIASSRYLFTPDGPNVTLVPNSIGSSRILDLNTTQKLRLRITSAANGTQTLLLSKSNITIVAI